MAAGGNFPLRGGGASVEPRLLGGVPPFGRGSRPSSRWGRDRARGGGASPGGAGPGGRGRARRSRLSLPEAGGRDRARRRRRLRREQHGLGHRAVGESDRPGSKFLPFWSPDPLPLCFCKTLAGARRFPLQRPLASPLFAFSRSFPGRFRTPRAKGDLAGADQGN